MWKRKDSEKMEGNDKGRSVGGNEWVGRKRDGKGCPSYLEPDLHLCLFESFQ